LIPLHLAGTAASENENCGTGESGDFLRHLIDFNCGFGADRACCARLLPSC
jgi:hypothetical protein